MTNKIRNEFASYGLEILKQSVLLVIYQLQKEDGLIFVRSRYIYDRLKIERIEDKTRRQAENDYLIDGILVHLVNDGYVRWVEHDTWQITEAGISAIET